jgi:hypothetical protein
MATVLAQAGFARAATDAELWRVNPAHSKLSIGSNTLTVEHAGTRDINSKAKTDTSFLVVEGRKVYLATPAAAFDGSKTMKDEAYSNWKGMRLIQIGDYARATVYCGSRCHDGVLENGMTITFQSVGSMDQANELLAANRP